MKPFLVILACISLHASAQHVDTNYLKSLYDRCLDFEEGEADSLHYYAGFIASQSRKLNFINGDVLSLRLKGLFYDLKGEYSTAIDYYLQSLTAAQRIKRVEYEIAALSDVAILYSHIKQPHKAKEMYQQTASLSEKQGYLESLITSYCNLGAIYNQLNMPDSARFFLMRGLSVGKPLEHVFDLSTLYNNLGNVHFRKKEYASALDLFKLNSIKHKKDTSHASLWVDFLNIADVFIEMKKFDSAHWYAAEALKMARHVGSKSKESDSYALLAKLHERMGEYRQAYEYQRRWYELDTSLVNEQTNNTIAELQEKYNLQKKQRENDLLQLEVSRQKLYKRATTYMALAAVIIALLIAVSLIQKRRSNRKLQAINLLITRQNTRLTELNNEKNSLISIVSHDLGTPFCSIRMWGQVLQAEDNTMNPDQRKALSRIMDSVNKGEALIKNVLDVEKAEISQYSLKLENFDLSVLIDDIIDEFRPMAWKKNINLQYDAPFNPLFIISDKQLVSRIFENLISNAIKFTHSDKSVWVNVSEEKDTVSIRVIDEGVGIAHEELPLLFSKYSKISSRPTDGEKSNGLGLSIVKRIVQELNGSIFCESEEGKGSVFTVVLKK